MAWHGSESFDDEDSCIHVEESCPAAFEMGKEATAKSWAFAGTCCGHRSLDKVDYERPENYDTWAYHSSSGRVYKYVYFDCYWHPWGRLLKCQSKSEHDPLARQLGRREISPAAQ